MVGVAAGSLETGPLQEAASTRKSNNDLFRLDPCSLDSMHLL